MKTLMFIVLSINVLLGLAGVKGAIVKTNVDDRVATAVGAALMLLNAYIIFKLRYAV